jgi:hypothetical protein
VSFYEVTVTTSADDVGLVVTRWALSPKLRGGWHLMFWTGIHKAHPECAYWSTDPAAAARFATVDDVEAALATLDDECVVAPFQLGLW